MLGTGVSARRNGGSMVVWGSQWLQEMSHIMNVLKKWLEKMVISNRKTVLLNWESLKKKSGAHYQSSWIPKRLCQVDIRKLIDEMKAERSRVPRELLEHFEEKVVRYIWPILTGDETWVHHYNPENKKQFMV